jgi:dimethylhistidine N-methyltransferase
VRIVETDAEAAAEDFAADVRRGLSQSRKALPAKYLYDEEGSRLFEQICDVEDYYLTRKETEILQAMADDLVRAASSCESLVELGSGNSRKTRILLEAFLRKRSRFAYRPIDISRAAIEESARDLAETYTELEIQSIVGTYEDGLEVVAGEEDIAPLVLFLGSSIGNLDPAHAASFLGMVRSSLQDTAGLLVGIDLRKDRATLERAYNDSEGVTAAFNRNLLRRINRELDGEFELDAFLHRAVYDEERGRVEMHLVSTRDQRVAVGQLDCSFAFKEGESIHTESSYKFSHDQIHALGESAGLNLRQAWTDRNGMFSVNLFVPAKAAA